MSILSNIKHNSQFDIARIDAIYEWLKEHVCGFNILPDEYLIDSICIEEEMMYNWGWGKNLHIKESPRFGTFLKADNEEDLIRMKYEITPDYKVNVHCNLILGPTVKHIPTELFNFGKVYGNVDVATRPVCELADGRLVTSEYFAEYLNKNKVSDWTQSYMQRPMIESLEGFPEEIYGELSLDDAKHLASLKGLTPRIHEGLILRCCDNLKNDDWKYIKATKYLKSYGFSASFVEGIDEAKAMGRPIPFKHVNIQYNNGIINADNYDECLD